MDKKKKGGKQQQRMASLKNKLKQPLPENLYPEPEPENSYRPNQIVKNSNIEISVPTAIKQQEGFDIKSSWTQMTNLNVIKTEPEITKPSEFELLLSSRSDGGHFQFKSEKKWETEINNGWIVKNNILNLDLNLLVNGISCLPFYEIIKLDKEQMSDSDIQECDNIAEKNRLLYTVSKEINLKDGNTVEKEECAVKLQKLEDAKNVFENKGLPSPPNLPLKSPQNIEPGNVLFPESFHIAKKVDACNSNLSHETSNNEKEENLEDWLDSVLDD